MDMFKTFKTVAGQRAGRIGERSRRRSRSRDRSRDRSKRPRLDSRDRDMSDRLRQRERSRERSNKPKKRDIPGNSSTNANLVPLGSKSRSSRGDDGKSERDSWYADPEARSVEDRQKCESFEWNDVKGSALADEDERERKKRDALKKGKGGFTKGEGSNQGLFFKKEQRLRPSFLFKTF